MVRVQVLGANVRNNPVMKRRQVRSDYRKIRAWAHVAMLNEIGKPWYKALLRVMFPVAEWKIVGLRTETPIVLRRRLWKVLDKQVVYLHAGRAKTSPIRRLVLVVAEHRENGAVQAFACTHWVSGAWNRKVKRHKAWRKVQWRLGWRTTDLSIDALYAAGISGVFFGDLNRVRVEVFGPYLMWAAGQGNIVKLATWEAPGGASMRVRDVGMDHDVETDHPMIRAVVEVRA